MNASLSRSQRVIEIVRLLHSVRKRDITQDDVDQLKALINTPDTRINRANFVQVAKLCIVNGQRNVKGCRMITNGVNDLPDSVLGFILNKPIAFFEDYPPYENATPSMSIACLRKTNAAYHCLNSSQKVAFQIIHKQISDSFRLDTASCVPESLDGKYTPPKIHSIEDSFFGVLNSRSGTGKSTIMGVMACSLLTPIMFVVYSNALKDDAATLHTNINARTTCNFIMHTLGLSYNQAKCIFNAPQSKTICSIFYDLLKLLKTFKMVPCNDGDFAIPYLIVFDEYTVMQPLMIIFLHMLSRQYKLNILMVGDANQQKAIRTSVYHKMNNMHLLKELASFDLMLTKQMRITDADYLKIIQTIELHLDEKHDNIRMDFHEKYTLYSLLYRHFHINECQTAMFLTATHRKMKDRIHRCFKESVKEGRTIVKAEYCRRKAGGSFEAVALPQNYKFAPLLVLIQGYSYIKYSETSKCEDVVQFVRKVSPTLIEVVNSSGRLEHLQRIAVNAYNTIDDLRVWLTSQGARYQYPLRFFTNTYYSAQGLTLDKCDMELDLDDTTMNAVYVGLTRIREGFRLKRLHTNDLCSLVYTHVKNDEYYYKVPEVPNLCEKYKITTDDLNQRIISVNSVLAYLYKTVTFPVVTPEAFRVSKGRCVRVLRTTYKEYVDSLQTNTSPLLDCYKHIKDSVNFNGLTSKSRRELHDTIQCPCTFKEEPQDRLDEKAKTDPDEVVCYDDEGNECILQYVKSTAQKEPLKAGSKRKVSGKGVVNKMDLELELELASTVEPEPEQHSASTAQPEEYGTGANFKSAEFVMFDSASSSDSDSQPESKRCKLEELQQVSTECVASNIPVGVDRVCVGGTDSDLTDSDVEVLDSVALDFEKEF
ncbi:Orf60 [Heliothis zea nudivirus]|uniref:Orf60 n=1 Tax=Heliothis zea nudivirus 1 TaxID=3116536 RepID=Q8JKQ1_9VIRU|nr:Orf60 [Heliothis zea nudivirus]AAN04354.1 Orf60 [Heliothis zea nudivirus]